MSTHNGNLVPASDIVVKAYHPHKIIMCGSVSDISNASMLDN